jgi:hypothetical protein
VQNELVSSIKLFFSTSRKKKVHQLRMFTLFDEIRNGNLEKIKEILFADQNLVNKYLYGVTPFLYSLECGNQDISLEMIQNSKVDFSLRDNSEVCCLEKAIASRMYKIVELICKNSKKLDMDKEILSNNETLLTNSIKIKDTQVSIALIKGILCIFYCNICQKVKSDWFYSDFISKRIFHERSNEYFISFILNLRWLGFECTE